MILRKLKKSLARRSKKRLAYGLAALTIAGTVAYGVGSYQVHQTKMLAQKDMEFERLQEANICLRKENKDLKQQVDQISQEKDKEEKPVQKQNTHTDNASIDVEVTAYTLSEESCGKTPEHPAYGKTTNGKDLEGETLQSARTIAVDPRIIPLGSKVKLTFHDKEMQQYNGIYIAADTGGAIKGNRIDLFAGEGEEALARHIGRRRAVATLL